jgi:hypothetical protein
VLKHASELTTEVIHKILLEENIEDAMRVDAYILFCDAIKNGLDDEIKTVFRVFLKNQDSSFLLTRL